MRIPGRVFGSALISRLKRRILGREGLVILRACVAGPVVRRKPPPRGQEISAETAGYPNPNGAVRRAPDRYAGTYSTRIRPANTAKPAAMSPSAMAKSE